MPVTSKSRPTARQSSSVAFIPFQVPTLVDAAPSGEGWLHEIKQDGYRTELIVESGTARAFTRRGLDWTERYPALVTASAQLAAKSAILDGEVVVQNELGISDFHALLPDPRASRGTLA